jgi:hypothetical protein
LIQRTRHTSLKSKSGTVDPLPTELARLAGELKEKVMNAKQIEAAKSVGRAIARSTKEDQLDRKWSGIEIEDADRLTASGIGPFSTDWAAAEEIAKTEYEIAMNLETV